MESRDKRNFNVLTRKPLSQVRILRYGTPRPIERFLVTSPIVINVPNRGLLAVETIHVIVQWLTNLNIKRNMTSMFINKKHRYR